MARTDSTVNSTDHYGTSPIATVRILLPKSETLLPFLRYRVIRTMRYECPHVSPPSSDPFAPAPSPVATRARAPSSPEWMEELLRGVRKQRLSVGVRASTQSAPSWIAAPLLPAGPIPLEVDGTSDRGVVGQGHHQSPVSGPRFDVNHSRLTGAVCTAGLNGFRAGVGNLRPYRERGVLGASPPTRRLRVALRDASCLASIRDQYGLLPSELHYDQLPAYLERAV